MDYASEIKCRVPATELLPFYGIQLNRSGFACCPLHGEKTPSLKAYSGDRGFHCFGCNAGGSVIDFVMLYFGLSFRDAVEKINADFGLGLPIHERISKQQKIEMSRLAYQAKKKREEEEKLNAVVDNAFDRWHHLSAQIDAHGEFMSMDEITPDIAKAMREIDTASYNLDCAMIDRGKHK